MAPETFQESRNFKEFSQEKVDVFSFAMVMYFLKYGGHPWSQVEIGTGKEKHKAELVNKYAEKGLRPPLDDHSSCKKGSCQNLETAAHLIQPNEFFWLWDCNRNLWVEKVMKSSIQLSKKSNFANNYEKLYLNLMCVMPTAPPAAPPVSSPPLQARLLESRS